MVLMHHRLEEDETEGEDEDEGEMEDETE
jgi:hypothetical protein